MARQPRRLMRQGVGDLPTRAHVDAYVGPNGEVISDGERLRLHDGATPGGIPMARIGRRAIQAQNDTANAADSYIAVTALTAPRAITLPAASLYAPGQPLYVADETGLCSADNGLTITVSAAGSDRIVGFGTSGPTVTMGSPSKFVFHSNGSNLWTVA